MSSLVTSFFDTRLAKLSIETALAAAAMSVLMSALLDVTVHPLSYVLLLSATLTFYNSDRAIDAYKYSKALAHKKITSQAQVPMTAFYVKATVLLLLLTVLLTVIAFGILPIIAEGPILLMLTVFPSLACLLYLYLLIKHETPLHYYKEIMVAFIFTLGVILPPLAAMLQEYSPVHWNTPPIEMVTQITKDLPLFFAMKNKEVFAPLSICFCLLLHNALLTSYAKRHSDKEKEKLSIILKLGTQRSRQSIHALGFFTLLAALVFLPAPKIIGHIFTVFFPVAIIIQTLLLRLENRLAHTRSFIFLIDGYFTPLIFLFFFIHLTTQ